MREGLLRFARNDNVQCAIKVHGRCHCEGLFRSNLPAFIKEIWLMTTCSVPSKCMVAVIARAFSEAISPLL